MALVESPLDLYDKMEDDISVADVYETALAIVNDFQTLMSQHGADSASGLMRRVVVVLEQLEMLATRCERQQGEIHELTSQLHHLEQARLDKRDAFAEELELIESEWKVEKEELQQKLTDLQRPSLQDSSEKTAAALKQDRDSVASFDGGMVEILQTKVTQLERRLRERDHTITSLQVQLDSAPPPPPTTSVTTPSDAALQQQLRQQADELTEVTNQLRHVCGATAPLSELRRVIIERNDLRARLTALQHEHRASIMEEPALEVPPPRPAPTYVDDDLPVYGPMPREPDDKLRERPRIRRFFSRLLNF